jgi:hypothetical protein
MSRNEEVDDALDVDGLVNEFYKKPREQLAALLGDPKQLRISIQLFLHDHAPELKMESLEKASDTLQRDILLDNRSCEIIDEAGVKQGIWDRSAIGTNPNGNRIVVGHIPSRNDRTHWLQSTEDRHDAIHAEFNKTA